MHKGILYILYYFPPVGTVGSLRNYNLSRELSPVFQHAHLITSSFKPFRMEEHFDLGYLDIHEVKHMDYRFLSGVVSRKAGLNDKVNALRKKHSSHFSPKWIDSYPANILWGEGGWLYIHNALKKAIRLIEQGNISHIYSSFRPMADHYIAYKLKKRFPDLFWIADFRDLPVDRHRGNVFFPVWHDEHYRKILSEANIVLTVSEGLKNQLIRYNEEVLVIRNGIRRMFLPVDPVLPDKFTITYTGSLYPGFQDPGPFFKAVKALIRSGEIDEDKLQIIYAGKDHRIWEGFIKEYELEHINQNKGKLSLTAAIRLQHESHLNILLSWSGKNVSGILTGKLYEYMAAQRPILGLVNGKRDRELEELINLYGKGKVICKEDYGRTAAFIRSEFMKYKAGDLQTRGTQNINYASLSWKSQIQPLIKFLS